MYPDVLSYDKIVELTGSFKAPMGCRSFLQGWKDENGVEVNSGRMNLGVVTVNLPRIAMESNGDINKFWEIFNERMGIAKDALVYRVERVKATRQMRQFFTNTVLLVNVSADMIMLMNFSVIAVQRFHLVISDFTKLVQSFMVQNGKQIQKPKNSPLISFVR